MKLISKSLLKRLLIEVTGFVILVFMLSPLLYCLINFVMDDIITFVGKISYWQSVVFVAVCLTLSIFRTIVNEVSSLLIMLQHSLVEKQARGSSVLRHFDVGVK